MHRLSREVRFSITPFAAKQPDGFNTYASKPTGAGLSFYLSLWVELEGTIDPDTGFIVNVSLIDQVVRSHAIPRFVECIRASLDARKPLSLGGLVAFMVSCARLLRAEFENKHHRTLKELRLALSPFRVISIDCESLNNVRGLPMITYSEKFEFAAMHKLWNDNFSVNKNLEVFGKCANPAGHGHNYIVEVAVEMPAECKSPKSDAWQESIQKIVKTRFIDVVDHKNLNTDVAAFKTLNPTVENIATLAWQSLAGQFGDAKLSYVTIWENDRTYCTYSEDN